MTKINELLHKWFQAVDRRSTHDEETPMTILGGITIILLFTIFFTDILREPSTSHDNERL
jgi:hypothetical protein